MQLDMPTPFRRERVLSAAARLLYGPSTTRFQPPPAVMRLSMPSNAARTHGFSLIGGAERTALHHPLLFRFRFGFLLGRFLLHFRFGLRLRLRLRLRLFHLHRLLDSRFWLRVLLHRRGSGPVAERVARRLADLLLLLYRLLLHLLLLHLLLLAGAARVGPPGSLYGTSFSCVGRCCISACICSSSCRCSAVS